MKGNDENKFTAGVKVKAAAGVRTLDGLLPFKKQVARGVVLRPQLPFWRKPKDGLDKTRQSIFSEVTATTLAIKILKMKCFEEKVKFAGGNNAKRELKM